MKNKWLIIAGGLLAVLFVGWVKAQTVEEVAAEVCNYHSESYLCPQAPDPNTVPPEPPEPPEPTEWDGGIVYSRLPRTTEPYTTTMTPRDTEQVTVIWPGLFDLMPETGHLRDGFVPSGQLVMRSPDGTEKIIYDCTGQPCAPLDPMVSNDGQKIAFSVYWSKEARAEQDYSGTPVKRNPAMWGTDKAVIHIYHIATDTLTAWPAHDGVYDISPAWLANGRIIFSSDRRGTWGAQLPSYRPQDPTFNLYTANPDGSGAVNVSPHEVNGAIHPYVTSSGRVVYSSFWMSHNLPFHAGAIVEGTTLPNQWALVSVDQGGGNVSALWGSHRNGYRFKDNENTQDNPYGIISSQPKALHFAGERANGDVCVANYYRRNNLGLGNVQCWPLQRIDFEGPAPTFLPEGIYPAVIWSSHADNPGPKDPNDPGVYIGKVGWPEGHPSGQLILTYGRGRCMNGRFREASDLQKSPADPGCDLGIYITTTIPSQHSSDLNKIVNSPQWHEFNARMIRSREISTGPQYSGDMCTLSVSSVFDTDAHRAKDYEFNSTQNAKAAANHGSEIDGLPPEDVASIRFYEVLQNMEQPEHGGKGVDMRNEVGNYLSYIGDAPVAKDGSLWTQIPCNVPYAMAGADSGGNLIKRDQYFQSLRPGENRQCGGCHLHGETGKPFVGTVAHGQGAKPLQKLFGDVPTFEEDIKPLFKAKCTTCHIDDAEGRADVPLYSYYGLVFDVQQRYTDYPVEVGKKPSRNLRRPNTSKYINNLFARESLLYWKAANKRTDGRTDATYDIDIDFGADHPTDLTPEEIKQIGYWIDSGAPR